MVVPSTLGRDALLLGLATFAAVCSDEGHEGRRLLKRTIRRLQNSPAVPVELRGEAIDGIKRTCGACKGCKGV